jgi:hypothetical protein
MITFWHSMIIAISTLNLWATMIVDILICKHYKKLVVEKAVNTKQDRPTASCFTMSKFYGKMSCTETQVMPFTDPVGTSSNLSTPSDDDSDVLPYPHVTSIAQNSHKREVKKHYFVLTVKEVFENMFAAAESKKKIGWNVWKEACKTASSEDHGSYYKRTASQKGRQLEYRPKT